VYDCLDIHFQTGRLPLGQCLRAAQRVAPRRQRAGVVLQVRVATPHHLGPVKARPEGTLLSLSTLEQHMCTRSHSVRPRLCRLSCNAACCLFFVLCFSSLFLFSCFFCFFPCFPTDKREMCFLYTNTLSHARLVVYILCDSINFVPLFTACAVRRETHSPYIIEGSPCKHYFHILFHLDHPHSFSLFSLSLFSLSLLYQACEAGGSFAVRRLAGGWSF